MTYRSPLTWLSFLGLPDDIPEKWKVSNFTNLSTMNLTVTNTLTPPVIYVSMISLFYQQHEQMSVQMFDDIVKSLQAENEDVLKEHGLDDKDVTFIKELIEGAKTSEVQTDNPAVYGVLINLTPL